MLVSLKKRLLKLDKICKNLYSIIFGKVCTYIINVCKYLSAIYLQGVTGNSVTNQFPRIRSGTLIKRTCNLYYIAVLGAFDERSLEKKLFAQKWAIVQNFRRFWRSKIVHLWILDNLFLPITPFKWIPGYLFISSHEFLYLHLFLHTRVRIGMTVQKGRSPKYISCTFSALKASKNET